MHVNIVQPAASAASAVSRTCVRIASGPPESVKFMKWIPTSMRVSLVSVILNRMVQSQPSVDRAFAALADPTRRAVLERLGGGSATLSELAAPFGMSLTGMSKHIRLLEEAELVTTEKIGRVRRCRLAPYAFEGISTWLRRLDRFAQVVERTKGAR